MDFPEVHFGKTRDPKKIAVWSVVILLLGGGITGIGVVQYQTYQETLDRAVEVDATVVQSDVLRADDGDETKYRLSVEYEYEYEGQQYRGSKFDVAGTVSEYDSRADAREARQDYREGTQVTAYVDPNDPSNAFLSDEMPTMVYVLLLIGVVLLLGVPVMIWYNLIHER